VFWLPPDSGEKITLTITILLALTVFLQFITEYTPKAAKTLPIIGLYFNMNLILVLISVILTIIVLNFHFRGPKKQRVPKWMRYLIIGHIGRFFCFCYESRAYNTFEQEINVQSLKNRPYTSNKVLSAKELNSNKNCGLDSKKCTVINAPRKHQVHINYVSGKCTKRSNSLDTESSAEAFENQIPAYVKVTKNERDYMRRDSHIVLECHDESQRFVSK